MPLARSTNASLASPAAAMPDRSPFTSAAKTGTPAFDRPSASTCSVTVLPVPVAPATRPWRLARRSSRYSFSLPLPRKTPSLDSMAAPLGCRHSLRRGRGLVYQRLLAAIVIVRRFARHHHVMDVALAQPRAGNAHELGAFVEVRDGGAAGIAHGGAQAADDLVHHAAHRALIGHLAF